MPKLHPEAAFFCLLWVALAFFGAIAVDLRIGIALSVGLFLIIMPASALILSKTGSFRLERNIRWGILGASGIALAIAAA